MQRTHGQAREKVSPEQQQPGDRVSFTFLPSMSVRGVRDIVAKRATAFDSFRVSSHSQRAVLVPLKRENHFHM